MEAETGIGQSNHGQQSPLVEKLVEEPSLLTWSQPRLRSQSCLYSNNSSKSRAVLPFCDTRAATTMCRSLPQATPAGLGEGEEAGTGTM